MPDDFDPYHKWLGIPPAEQPANYYRLLGLALYESDTDVIDSAADQRMYHVRSFQTGQHSDLSQKLLNELTTARLTLLNADRKGRYDRLLKIELADKQPGAAPSAARAEKTPRQSESPLSPAARSAAEALANVSSSSLRSGKVAPAANKLSPAAPGGAEKWKDAAVAPAGPKARASAGRETMKSLALEALAEEPATMLPSRHRPKAPIGWWIVAWTCGLTAFFIVSHFDWLTHRTTVELAQRDVQEREAAQREAASKPATPDKQPAPPAVAVNTGGPKPTPDATASTSIVSQPPDANPATNATTVPSTGTQNSSVESHDTVHNQPSPPKGTDSGAKTDSDPFAIDRPASVAAPPRPHVEPIPFESLATAAPASGGSAGETALAQPRQPLPDAATLQQAQAEVTATFKDELKRAKTRPEQLELAHRLRRQAEEAHLDAPQWHAAICLALDLAERNGDVVLASQLVDDLSAKFDIDRAALGMKALAQLAQGAKKSDAAGDVAKLALALANRALATDNPAHSVELAGLSLSLFPSGSNMPLRDVARETLERAHRMQRQSDDYRAAIAKLQASANDADASAVVGRYLCFVRRNWKAGLPALAESSDAIFQPVAKLESQGPPQDPLALADAWWDAADKAGQAADEAAWHSARSRAAYWYRQAVDQASGLQLVKIERRIAAADPQGAGFVLAWWRFEDGYPCVPRPLADALVSTDSSGNGNDLWLEGQPPPGEQGALFDFTETVVRKVPLTGEVNNACYSFKTEPSQWGDRSLISRHAGAGRDVNTPPVTKWTVELSAYLTAQGRAQALLSAPPDTASQSKGLSIDVLLDGKLMVTSLQLNAPAHQLTSSKPLPLNHWFHVAVTGDGESMKLYLDRGDVGGYRLESSTPLTGAIGGAGAWTIGRGAQPMGFIDELRICDVALEPGEFLFDGPNVAAK